MKKSLEGELLSIAHRILQLKNKADVHELKAVTGVLYEKLSVLSFAEKHFSGPQPSIGKKQIEEALSENSTEKTSEEKPVAKKERPDGTEHNTEQLIQPNTELIKSIVAEMPMEMIKEIKEKNHRPDGLEHNEEAITEPNTEKIKDIVAQMFPESQEVDEVLEEILPQKKEKTKDELRDLGVHYDELPQFEPVAKKPKPSPEEDSAEKTSTEKEQEKFSEEENKSTQKEESPKQEELFYPETPEFEPKNSSKKTNDLGEHKRSLNDRLKKGINIGLNDRLAYIKHLFDGNAADYNRVLSQLNTIENFAEAQRFIQQQIKPDYNNWEGKEEYENRFLQAIENRFD
ncbi:hypothetical protein [Mesonia maritima]|uniref:Uncharacterized protein n=1 Tax=Mesonia maritima TaxID=1793873 RepID=A0ABU1K294_9FLAO|nr:hypothetical protein [Mesonia maritima]MDR6299738.1 hypothetical protein [Mesonia maritima]